MVSNWNEDHGLLRTRDHRVAVRLQLLRVRRREIPNFVFKERVILDLNAHVLEVVDNRITRCSSLERRVAKCVRVQVDGLFDTLLLTQGFESPVELIEAGRVNVN